MILSIWQSETGKIMNHWKSLDLKNLGAGGRNGWRGEVTVHWVPSCTCVCCPPESLYIPQCYEFSGPQRAVQATKESGGGVFSSSTVASFKGLWAIWRKDCSMMWLLPKCPATPRQDWGCFLQSPLETVWSQLMFSFWYKPLPLLCPMACWSLE